MTRLASITAVCLLVAVSMAASLAHEITYKGTVVSADDKKVVVTVVDEKTKKPAPMTFKHDDETKILRGDAVVTYAQARILKGEKIAVTINHDDLPDFALVIRLDEKK
jgi:hypothetical protein